MGCRVRCGAPQKSLHNFRVLIYSIIVNLDLLKLGDGRLDVRDFQSRPISSRPPKELHMNAIIDSLSERNAAFASERFSTDLKLMPSKKTMIIGCVDPRVDPLDIFGLAPGEAAILRNVGGRADPATLRSLGLLRAVVKSRSGGAADCQLHAPDMLARHMAVAADGLDALAFGDPHRAVKSDIAALQANPQAPAGLTVTGMVYDVASGKVEIVVPPVVLSAQSVA